MASQTHSTLQTGKPALLDNVYSKAPSNGRTDIGLVLGLSIGLPVGLSCISIIVLSIYFTRRWRKRNQQEHTSRKFEYNSTSGDYRESTYIGFEPVTPTGSWHIRTPRKAHATDIGLADGKSKLEADDLLYSRPPNIYSINSSISSTAEITPRKVRTGQERKLRNNNNWKYESPLSKWFLRSSLYLRNLSDNQVPTANIKNTNILTSVIEGWGQQGTTSLDDGSTSDDTFKSMSEASAGKTQGSSSVIQSQTLQLEENVGVKEVALDPGISTSSRKARSKLRRHLEYVKMAKPLPLTPGNKGNSNVKRASLRVGQVYVATEQYVPSLPDEIYVVPGEKLRVLATHSDGWCLVERETVANGSDYLNRDRGIVPSYCIALKK